LKPLRSSTLLSCRLDDEVIWRKPLSHILFIGDAGLADSLAHEVPHAAVHGGPDLVVGLEGKADTRQPDRGTNVDSVIDGAANGSMPPAVPDRRQAGCWGRP
jgi:hypothetical protein